MSLPFVSFATDRTWLFQHFLLDIELVVVVVEMSFASIGKEPLKHLSTVDKCFCNIPVIPATLIIHESACLACHVSTFRNMPESCV